jgi:hypothetical protein
MRAEKVQKMERYLKLDSSEFKAALWFFGLALAALFGLVLCLAFELAGVWGVTLGVLILLFGTMSGSFLHRALRYLQLGENQDDSSDPEGDDQADGDMPASSVSLQQNSLSLGASDNSAESVNRRPRQKLDPQELEARSQLYDFVYEVTHNQVLGEGRWVEKGLSRRDYRTLIDYLALCGILRKREGATPEIRLHFRDALDAIATQKRDPAYWNEITPFLINPIRSRGGQQEAKETLNSQDPEQVQGEDE